MANVDGVARCQTRFLSAIFILIALAMIFIPRANLMQDGVDIAKFNVAGRAEVRAYYVGTALCVAFAIWSLETHDALKAVRGVCGYVCAHAALIIC